MTTTNINNHQRMNNVKPQAFENEENICKPSSALRLQRAIDRLCRSPGDIVSLSESFSGRDIANNTQLPISLWTSKAGMTKTTPAPTKEKGSPHSDATNESEHSDRQSKSGLSAAHLIWGQSEHGEGSEESKSTSRQDNISANFSHDTMRSRTVTKSRRSVQIVPRHNSECRYNDSGNGEMVSSVIVHRKKGQSTFVHLVTTDALPVSSRSFYANANKSGSGSRRQPSNAEDLHHDITTLPCPEKHVPKLLTEGRAESVTNERRCRPFFRTTDRRRSRARSPGPRRGHGNSASSVNAGSSSAMNMTNSKFQWIRRESPSPQPATRKRT